MNKLGESLLKMNEIYKKSTLNGETFVFNFIDGKLHMQDFSYEELFDLCASVMANINNKTHTIGEVIDYLKVYGDIDEYNLLNMEIKPFNELVENTIIKLDNNRIGQYCFDITNDLIDKNIIKDTSSFDFVDIIAVVLLLTLKTNK